MEELLGLGELEEALYESWSAGGYGMIITGPYPHQLPSFIRLWIATHTWVGAHARDGLQATSKSRRITSDSRSTLPFRNRMTATLLALLRLLPPEEASPAGQKLASLLASRTLQHHPSPRRPRSPSCS